MKLQRAGGMLRLALCLVLCSWALLGASACATSYGSGAASTEARLGVDRAYRQEIDA